MMWLVSVGAVTVVVVAYWVMLDFVFDRFGLPPATRDGNPA